MTGVDSTFESGVVSSGPAVMNIRFFAERMVLFGSLVERLDYCLERPSNTGTGHVQPSHKDSSVLQGMIL